MSIEVHVPELEDSAEGAKLTRWLKKPGDRVEKGEEIAEVETEKALVEVVAPSAGSLSQLFVQEGQPVRVGLAIASIEDIEVQPVAAATPVTEAGPIAQYDLIVIGSGPGGYVCAIRASQLGLKVAVVEKRSTYGGTCLNVGCIPSKALLYASEMFDEATRDFARLGIEVSSPKIDVDKLMLHKSTTVDATVKGVAFLFRKNKIAGYHGTGSLLGNGRVQVTQESGEKQIIAAENIVIATGSAPAMLRGIEIDEKRIITSDSAIALKSIPDRLLIIGAGAIGLELGSVWNRLGSHVTVVEYLDHILSGFDRELSVQFQRSMEQDGVRFKLSTAVTAIDDNGAELKVSVKPAAGGAEEIIPADVVLVAVGRIPYSAGVGLDSVGVVLDERDRIKTDREYRTTVPGIWAIGDVIVGPMLAHKASDEGVAVAENIAGQKGRVNYGAIPSVVYTKPEIASVGKTEEELKHDGIEYSAGRFPFIANGRARAMLKTDGLVKILAEKNSGKVLGAHILGASAGELIAELTLLIQMGGTAEQLATTCHAHPTLSEAIREAALGTMGRRINI